MVDKKKLMADLDSVGQLIAEAQKSGKPLTASQVQHARHVLGSAASELFKLKTSVKQTVQVQQIRTAALKKSVAEKLIAEAEGATEIQTLTTASANLNAQLVKIADSVAAVKKLSNEVNKLAASPELEQLEKGHVSDEAIKAPQAAAKVAAEGSENGMTPVVHDEGTVPVNRPPQKELGKGMPPLYPDAGNIEELEQGVPKPNTQTSEVAPAKDPAAAPEVTASKARAKSLYTRAMSLVKAADSEKDATKKAQKIRMAKVFEKMADNIVNGKVARKVASTDKAGATTVYAANDRVLLADGSVGTVSSANGEQLKVNVAGIEKDVIATTCKKISVKKVAEAPVSVKADEKMVTIKIPTEKVEQAVEKLEEKENKVEPAEKPAEKTEKPEVKPVEKEEPKMASISDRIKNAIALVRGTKRVAAEPAPAIMSEAPKAEAKPESDTVGKTFTTTYAPAANGKFTVQISETELVECDTEDEAKALVSRSAKTATTNNAGAPTDSSTTKEPAAAADVAKTLRGLDQKGKDYGKTTKEEQVDPQFSMVKKSTTNNAGAPTDSSTTKEPDSMTGIQKELRGLDQRSKDYGKTTKEEVVDPQFSMVKKSDLDLKLKIMASTNAKQAERLAVVESDLLADRAVKVGAVAEEQRSEQRQVLAELYKESPAEFKAYSRLIATLEVKASTTPNLANRQVRRVEAAIARRNSEVVDAVGSTAASLEDGTFFEDER